MRRGWVRFPWLCTLGPVFGLAVAWGTAAAGEAARLPETELLTWTSGSRW